jgi:hypothetical protein
MAEMNRLCDDPEDEGEAPDLTGLDDAERVREMVHTVKAAANKQATDFLELCGREIDNHFTSLEIKKLGREKKPDWQWMREVGRSSFWCGVCISAPPKVRISMENDVCGVVVPYLWAKGGRKGEEEVGNILGGLHHSREDERLFNVPLTPFGRDSGTVYLRPIPIKAQPPESFDVDREQLIAEVMKIIARIGAKETKAIAKLVAGLQESDEI